MAFFIGFVCGLAFMALVAHLHGFFEPQVTVVRAPDVFPPELVKHAEVPVATPNDKRSYRVVADPDTGEQIRLYRE